MKERCILSPKLSPISNYVSPMFDIEFSLFIKNYQNIFLLMSIHKSSENSIESVDEDEEEHIKLLRNQEEYEKQLIKECLILMTMNTHV